VTTGIVRRLSPEEEELAKKRDELALLQVQLAERELYVANLRAELTGFEGRYLRQVGVLYAELDDWSAKIAELVAEESGTDEARSAATQARAQAAESRSASHSEVAESKQFAPSPELKSLYREVAKRVHPDLASDDTDRTQRERLMAQANRAYENGDAEALRRILQEYEGSPDSVRGTGVAADLVRILRQLKQVRNRLAQIEEEIASLGKSDIAILQAKAEDAGKKGRDLLAEMAANVQGRINVARHNYESEARRLRTIL
jgi:hypothetical protein